MTRLPPNSWAGIRFGQDVYAAGDEVHVRAFNRQLDDTKNREAFLLHTELMPEPFMGDPARAKVVLLQLNPGFVPADLEANANRRFRAQAKANLTHSADYPAFLLDRTLDGPAGWTWWNRATGPLRNALTKRLGDEGEAIRRLATGLLAVEFHRYHSNRHLPLPITLPSQHYGFALVRRAVERKIPVLIARGERVWKVAVPELSARAASVTLTNWQRTSISPANLDYDGRGSQRFERLVTRLCE